MAGDWMKIDLELPDKPEVHYIAGVCSLDPDSVVGKLIRVWQWFDKHTTDGNAVGVTFALVDRLVGVTGFAESMQFAGWLEQRDKVLCMPKFDRHTSESAKKRALSAKRQSKFRNAEVTQNVTQSALPREEKRRVNNNTRKRVVGEGFSDFWSAYPKKIGKGAAEKAWEKVPPDSLPAILASIAVQRASPQWTKDGGQFVPNPATWLNQRRWEDSPPEAGRPQLAVI